MAARLRPAPAQVCSNATNAAAVRERHGVEGGGLKRSWTRWSKTGCEAAGSDLTSDAVYASGATGDETGTRGRRPAQTQPADALLTPSCIAKLASRARQRPPLGWLAVSLNFGASSREERGLGPGGPGRRRQGGGRTTRRPGDVSMEPTRSRAPRSYDRSPGKHGDSAGTGRHWWRGGLSLSLLSSSGSPRGRTEPS